jgi:hypothetical protein
MPIAFIALFRASEDLLSCNSICGVVSRSATAQWLHYPSPGIPRNPEQESIGAAGRPSITTVLVLTIRLSPSSGAGVAGQSQFPRHSGRTSRDIRGPSQRSIAISSPLTTN